MENCGNRSDVMGIMCVSVHVKSILHLTYKENIRRHVSQWCATAIIHNHYLYRALERSIPGVDQ